ncbi:hypothetical protein [Saccharomonospora viridis]|uniref:hypothetical protein n=1 Tax=Saccharomonospora viridis TaxID=1852 RepID=UPI0023F4D631|nr:hypothetical protein [Saccharomonospora viridis]
MRLMRRTAPDDDRARRIQQSLAVPVLAAALLSIPAVFLTTAPGLPGVVGRVLNWLSLAVLVGESAALLWFSGSVRLFVRRYRAQLLIVAITVPAVVFVIGPTQVLRILLMLGAFRILRVRRILRAGRMIVHRTGLDERRGRWALAGVGAVAAVFAATVLADPESRSRKTLAWVVDHLGLGGTVLAGLGVTTIALVVAVLLRKDTRG